MSWIPNAPNAGRLLNSLRSTNYDNYLAIADLVDNSGEAQASIIKIDVKTENKQVVFRIADNGTGMTRPQLLEALKLGSISERPETERLLSGLGKFGFGLKTATLAIGRRTTVFTRAGIGTPLLKGVNDLDEITRRNEFVTLIDEASAEEIEWFESVVGKSSGTIVAIDNCDNVQNSNTTQFTQLLARRLGRIYRHFLWAKKFEIIVNGTTVSPFDPLNWNGEKVTKWDDNELVIEIKDGDLVVKESVSIKIALLYKGYADKENDSSLTRDQGISLVRNNREVGHALTLGIYKKDAWTNYFRCEIRFSGKLDKYFGVSFTKNNDDRAINQSLLDQLSKYIKPQINSISKRLQRDVRVETPEEMKAVHELSEDLIFKKSAVLITPPVVKEKRSPKNGLNNTDKDKSDETGSPRTPGSKNQPGFLKKAHFEFAQLGADGQFYISEQRGQTTVVTWNTQHPFYALISNNITQDRLVNALDFLVYSLASAEMISFTSDDQIAILNNYKQIVSTNLRTLLS